MKTAGKTNELTLTNKQTKESTVVTKDITIKQKNRAKARMQTDSTYTDANGKAQTVQHTLRGGGRRMG